MDTPDHGWYTLLIQNKNAARRLAYPSSPKAIQFRSDEPGKPFGVSAERASGQVEAVRSFATKEEADRFRMDFVLETDGR